MYKFIENKKPFFYSILASLKLPIVFLTLGIMLKCLIFINPPFNYPKWNLIVALSGNLGNIFILMAFLVFSFLVALSVCNRYEKYFHGKEYKTIAHIVSIIKNGLKVVFLLLTVNLVLSQFEIAPKYSEAAHNITYVIIIAATAWILLQILSMIENKLYRNSQLLAVSPDARRAIALYTRIHIIKNIAATLIIITAFAASLMIFDKVRSIGISLLASAGFITAIFALAGQKTLGSLFAGLQLVVTHPLEIGDLVVVENESGIVEEISLSYVIIKVWDARRLILPINYFIEKPFQNLSRGDDGLLGVIKIYMDYTLPIEPLRSELNKIIKQVALWDGKVCTLAVSDCKEHLIEIRIIVSTENPADIDKLRCEIREKLLNFICKMYPESLPKYRIIPFERKEEQQLAETE